MKDISLIKIYCSYRKIFSFFMLKTRNYILANSNKKKWKTTEMDLTTLLTFAMVCSYRQRKYLNPVDLLHSLIKQSGISTLMKTGKILLYYNYYYQLLLISYISLTI